MHMLKLVLALSAMVAAAYAGWSSHGHGGASHSPHGGWGWKKYEGWANVKAWQGPWSHQYSLDEQGKGYNKYAWVQQESSKGWHGK